MLKKILIWASGLLIVLYLFGPWLLTRAGEFLVVDDAPIEPAQAVVVLSTGVDYLPRLMQAATLFKEGLATMVVINGNRKTEVHRQFEAQGYSPSQVWYEEAVSMLVFLGVKREKILPISAEDAYDTVSEATLVGQELKDTDIRKIIITTSKFHTRRSKAIWRHLYSGQFDLQVAAAANDSFTADGWWHHGRHIRQVLAEYGAWLYFWGKKLQD